MFYFHKYSCSHSHTDPTSAQTDGWTEVRRPQEAQQGPVNEGDRTPVQVLPWPEAPEPSWGHLPLALPPGQQSHSPTAPQEA